MKSESKFLAFALLLTCTFSQAQMTSGYRFGINLTTMKLVTPGLSSEPQRPMGIHFGGNFEIPVSGKFYFQSGALFTAKGTDYDVDSIYHSLAPAFVEIPMSIAYKFGIRRSTKYFVYAGPYIAFAMGGYKIIGGDPISNISWGKDGDLRRFDTGFNLGIGINRNGNVFSVQYGTGLSNLSPLKGSMMKNRVISISISSLRPPKKK
jgi:hypothetical protein